MSLTPGTPNLASQIAVGAKGFWSRREGTTGKVVLVAGAVAIAAGLFTAWGTIVPFVLGTFTNTIYLALDVIFLMFLTSPIWSKRVRLLVGLAFKLSMRWSTQLFIETDPFGILREKALDMKKGSVTISKAADKASSSVEGTKMAIDKNKEMIQNCIGSIKSAESMVADLQSQLPGIKDPMQAMKLRTKMQSIVLKKQNYQQKIGLASGSIEQEQRMLDAGTAMYENLLKYQNLQDYKTEEFVQTIDMLEERQKILLAGQEGLTVMQKLLGGDPEGQDLIDRDIAYLNQQAADITGAIANFNRYSDKYLTDMDIQNGAAAQKGADIFAALEQKLTQPLLPDGGLSANGGPIETVQDSQGTYVPASNGAIDYSKLLK
jgi:hypothetical protein